MEKLPITIHRFYTVYEDNPKSPGTTRERDMVEYGPIGQGARTRCVERIDVLSKAQKIAGANPAAMAAKVLWDFIGPRYEAWKKNQELPETGTPLAAWNHLTPTQAEFLRVNGVRTVEELALLTDTHIHQFKIHNLRSIIEAAKKFVVSVDVNKFAGELQAKDDQLAAANARIDQMAEMMAKLMEDKQPSEEPPKRRGRPPKLEQSAA
jgi:hypothetical protein